MQVEKVLLQKYDWVAFLGYHRTQMEDEVQQKDLVIFSQGNLGECLYSYKAEFGTEITDVAVLGLDTIALARNDGSISVKILLKKEPQL